MPQLFDCRSFSTLKPHLEKLSEAKIDQINLEGSIYTLDEVIKIVEQAEKFNSDPANWDKDPDKYLGQTLGVTRKKISAESQSGFRDCLKRCLANQTIR